MREKASVEVFGTKWSSPCGVCTLQGCAVYWCLHDDGDLSLEHDEELIMCMGDMWFYVNCLVL